jgi:hypothetical protein
MTPASRYDVDIRLILRIVVAMVLATYGAFTGASERAPGKEAIQRMLLEQRQWMLIYEITSELVPGATATRTAHAFYMRDGRLLGQWTDRPSGFECVYEVKLRDDGFGFMQCGGYANQPHTELEYDPQDSRYPFKRLNTPSKWWLEKR